MFETREKYWGIELNDSLTSMGPVNSSMYLNTSTDNELSDSISHEIYKLKNVYNIFYFVNNKKDRDNLLRNRDRNFVSSIMDELNKITTVDDCNVKLYKRFSGISFNPIAQRYYCDSEIFIPTQIFMINAGDEVKTVLLGMNDVGRPFSKTAFEFSEFWFYSSYTRDMVFKDKYL